MHEFGEGSEDMGRVGALIVLVLQQGEGRGHVALHDEFEEVDDACPVRDAQHVAQCFGGDGRVGTRPMGDGLVEQREGVAHRAFRRARNQRQRIAVDGHALLGADTGEMIDQNLGLDAAQVEALAARAHRHRHLLDLGGGEEELHMLGRFLERLQQRVERVLRQHVHFVDDIDLGACHDRAEARVLDDLAHVVDARMGGGVHLDDVDVPTVDDGLAVDTEFRHVDRRPGHGRMPVLRRHFVVEGTGKDAGGRGLADPAHAGQQIGLMDAVELEGIREGAHHRFLTDEVLEA